MSFQPTKLSVSPKARGHYRKALKKLSKDRETAAEKHLAKAVEISPQFIAAWIQLGTIAYNRGDYGRAVEHFREALSCDGESFLATVSLAGALIELGRYEEALHYSAYAQMKQPDHAEANAQLGINYFHLKRDEEALAYLLRAKRIDPGHYSYPQIYLAKIYGRTGRPVEAISELEDLLERQPDLPAGKQIAETIEELRNAVAEPESEPAP